MKKLGRIHKLGLAGLSALALAAPVALAQSAGNDQGQERGGRAERGEHRGHRGGKRGGGEWGGRGGHFGGMMFRGVELTDAQKASLKQLRESFGERTKSLREQLHAKRDELRQAESGSTFNEQLAAQKLAEASTLQAKLMAEEFKLRQDSLALLTPEQKAQLEQRKQQRQQRREQWKAQRNATPQQ